MTHGGITLIRLAVGDYVEFELATYTNKTPKQSFRVGIYEGHKPVSGTIHNIWIDRRKQEWFSVKTQDGKTQRVKGRNLYSTLKKSTRPCPECGEFREDDARVLSESRHMKCGPCAYGMG